MFNFLQRAEPSSTSKSIVWLYYRYLLLLSLFTWTSTSSYPSAFSLKRTLEVWFCPPLPWWWWSMIVCTFPKHRVKCISVSSTSGVSNNCETASHIAWHALHFMHTLIRNWMNIVTNFNVVRRKAADHTFKNSIHLKLSTYVPYWVSPVDWGGGVWASHYAAPSLAYVRMCMPKYRFRSSRQPPLQHRCGGDTGTSPDPV